jgi:hypothetical protein
MNGESFEALCHGAKKLRVLELKKTIVPANAFTYLQKLSALETVDFSFTRHSFDTMSLSFLLGALPALKRLDISSSFELQGTSLRVESASLETFVSKQNPKLSTMEFVTPNLQTLDLSGFFFYP